MSYAKKTKNKPSPQSAIIPVSELDRILDEYQAAIKQTKELVRLNDERQQLFTLMQENFDILFGEVELLRTEAEKLKKELVEKDKLLDDLRREIKRLKNLKKIKVRLKNGEFVDYSE